MFHKTRENVAKYFKYNLNPLYSKEPGHSVVSGEIDVPFWLINRSIACCSMLLHIWDKIISEVTFLNLIYFKPVFTRLVFPFYKCFMNHSLALI